MDAVNLLMTRESAMKLQAPGPSEDELDQMFASAGRAPDHGKLRPWRFVVIPTDRRAAFGEVMADCAGPEGPQDSGDRADCRGLGGRADDHAGRARAGLWRDVEDRRPGL